MNGTNEPTSGGIESEDFEFEVMTGKPPAGLIRRFFVTQIHLLALVLGGAIATARDLHPKRKYLGLGYLLLKLVAFLARPFVNKSMRKLPFSVQLRKRLEMLGPTYIKLGQVLSLREDILPRPITAELKNLLDRLPVVPFETYVQLIEKDLGRPLDEMFQFVDPRPLGSASIAQIHRATTVEGDDVIIKVVKPGIVTTLKRDARLLTIFSAFLELFFSRFQPRRMIREFVEYTLREVNFNLEADNADTFRANFRDMKQVVFPMIFRQYSGTRVLCMSFLKGDKPNSEKVRQLPLYERERLIDIGAEAIIRMIYRDGFFHADLHPGNLIVLEDGRCGFIDLGMVGRFDDELRRKLLYYYYCLVIGDPNNAARYLADLADRDSKSDPKGFMRATTDLSRRWHSHSNFKEFSLAQLVMASVALGAQYRMYFPVEMVLMVKALVTYEGVGNYLKPGFDVARVSKKHITGLFFHQFNPANLFTEHLRLAPDMLDAYLKFPLLVTESFKYLRKRTQVPDPPVNRGLRETVLSSAFIISGTILAAVDQAWWTFVPLFVLGFFFVFHRSD